jgi:hypothetical protein
MKGDRDMPDFTKNFNSVEELESMLEEEFKTEETEDETEETEETEDETDETDETDELDEEDEVDEDEPSLKKDLSKKEPSGDEEFVDDKKKKKEEFAFNKLREEKSQLKKEIIEKEEKLKFWEQVAKQYGYENAQQFAEEVRKKQLEEEAKSKNVDPEIYRKLKDMEDELARVKQEREQVDFQNRTSKFVETFESFIKENSLNEDERTKIIQNLDEEGWDLQSLVNIKNPKKLLQGYAVDIIAERKVQNKLSKDKKKLAEEKFNRQEHGNKSVDDLVKDELAKYRKEMGYK